MTGYKSKRAAALDEEGMYLVHQTASYADNLGKSIVALGKQTVADIEQLGIKPAQDAVALRREYQSGYYDGEKAALAGREWNFCERCGKRTADMTTIHTCTPPQENT